jgi:hypothetical protein
MRVLLPPAKLQGSMGGVGAAQLRPGQGVVRFQGNRLV